MLPPPVLALLLASGVSATESWRMLDQYPNHYVTRKLGPAESIKIDGKLDDPAWVDAVSQRLLPHQRHLTGGPVMIS